MRKLSLIVFICTLFILSVSSFAQDDNTASMDANQVNQAFVLRVFADSIFIRALPSLDAEPVNYAVEEDNLVAVGRNADGTWFEVRKPGQYERIGWVSKRWVAFSFEIASLPLTDLTTEVTGPDAVYSTGVDIFVLTQAALRDAPSFNSNEIGILPISVTVPVIERSPDNLWLRVNYLGQVGWVAEFLTRIVGTVTTVPISPEFEFQVVNLEIIPVEVQLAQAQRLRDYINPLYDTAGQMANFWSLLQSGEVVPCQPPSGGYGYFSLTPQDIKELPELRLFNRRLGTAVDDLNTSIRSAHQCGVFTTEQLSTAYAQAINARSIFRATLGNITNLEVNILGQEPPEEE